MQEDQYALLANLFFSQQAKLRNKELNNINDIYSNFELLRDIFEQFGFPHFMTYSECLKLLKEFGAQEIEFSNPISLFSNFVEFVILKPFLNDYNGLQGLGLFINNAVYNEETLQTILKTCFPISRNPISELLQNKLPDFTEYKDEISIFYELCFLYYYFCKNGPLTADKMLSAQRSAIIQNYEQQLNDEEMSRNELFTYLDNVKLIELHENDAELLENLSNTLQDYSNTELKEHLEGYFELHANLEFSYLESFQLDNQVSEPPAIENIIKHTLKCFNEREENVNDILRTLAENMVLANVQEEVEKLLKEVTIEQITYCNTIDELQDFLLETILQKFNLLNLNDLIEEISELLTIDFPIIQTFTKDEILQEIEQKFEEFAGKQSEIGILQSKTQHIELHINCLMSAMSENIKDTDKREISREFLLEKDSLLGECPDSLKQELLEAIEIAESQEIEGINTNESYRIEYENKAKRIYDSLLRQFLTFVDIMTCADEVEEISHDALEAQLNDIITNNNYLLISESELENFGDDFALSSVEGRKIIEIKDLELQYNNYYISNEMKLLKELENKMADLGIKLYDGQYSYGFLEILQKVNEQLYENARKLKNQCDSLMGEQNTIAFDIRMKFIEIIEDMKLASEKLTAIEFTKEITIAELQEYEQDLQQAGELLNEKSLIADSLVELVEIVFNELLVHSLFNVESILTCISLVFELKSKYDEMSEEKCELSNSVSTALNQLLCFKEIIGGTTKMSTEMEEFDYQMKNLVENEEQFIKIDELLSELNGAEYVADIINGLELEIVSRNSYCKSECENLAEEFMEEYSNYEKELLEYEALRKNTHSEEEEMLILAPQDYELINDKINEFTQEIEKLEQQSIAQESFEFIPIIAELKCLLQKILICIHDYPEQFLLTLGKFESVKAVLEQLYVKDSELQQLLVNIEQQITIDSQKISVLEDLKLKVSTLLLSAQELQNIAENDLQTVTEQNSNKAIFEEQIRKIQSTDLEECYLLNSPIKSLNYLYDVYNSFSREYSLSLKLEPAVEEQAISQIQYDFLKEINNYETDFIEMLYNISEEAVKIKNKRSNTSEDILYLKQVIIYIPFLNDFAEAIKVLNNKAQVDQLVKQFAQKYQIDLATIYVPEKPTNFDLLSKAQQNFNSVKTYNSTQFGTISSVLQEYLTEDVMIEYKQERRISAITEQDENVLHDIQYQDFAIFGLTQVANRFASYQAEFSQYHENICNFCEKELPEISSSLQPIELSDELILIQERSLHLQQTCYIFDKRVGQAIAALFAEQREIQVPSLENYQKRLENSLVCGCAGLPRNLLIVLEELEESKKYVEQRNQARASSQEARQQQIGAKLGQMQQEYAACLQQCEQLRRYPELSRGQLAELQQLITSLASLLLQMALTLQRDASAGACSAVVEGAAELQNTCQHMQMQYNNHVVKTTANVVQATIKTQMQDHAIFGNEIQNVVNSLILKVQGIEPGDVKQQIICENIQYIALYERYFEYFSEYEKTPYLNARNDEDSESYLYTVLDSVNQFLFKLFQQFANESAELIQFIIQQITNKAEFKELAVSLKNFVDLELGLVEGVDYELNRLTELRNSELLVEDKHLNTFHYVYDCFLRIDCIAKSVRQIIICHIDEFYDNIELSDIELQVQTILDNTTERFQAEYTDISAAKLACKRELLNLQHFAEVTLPDRVEHVSKLYQVQNDCILCLQQIYQTNFGINLQITPLSEDNFIEIQETAKLVAEFEILCETPEQISQKDEYLSVAPIRESFIKALFIINIYQKLKLPNFKLPVLEQSEVKYTIMTGKVYCENVRYLLEKIGSTNGKLHKYYNFFLKDEMLYIEAYELQEKNAGALIVNERLIEPYIAEFDQIKQKGSLELIKQYKEKLVNFILKNRNVTLKLFEPENIGELQQYLCKLSSLVLELETKLVDLELIEFKSEIEGNCKIMFSQFETINQSTNCKSAFYDSYNAALCGLLTEWERDLCTQFPILGHLFYDEIISSSKTITILGKDKYVPEFKEFEIKENPQLVLEFLSSSCNTIIKQKSLLSLDIALLIKEFPLLFNADLCLEFVEEFEELELVELQETSQLQLECSECNTLNGKIKQFEEKLLLYIKQELEFAIPLHECYGFNKVIDVANSPLLDELQDLVDEFPFYKDEIELLTNAFSAIEQNDLIEGSFKMSFQSTLLENLGRASCILVEAENTDVEVHLEKFVKEIQNTHVYNQYLSIVVKYCEDLLSNSFTIQALEQRDGDTFHLFDTDFLLQEENYSTLLLSLQTAIIKSVGSYAEQMAIRPRSLVAEAKVSLNLEFLVTHFTSSLDEMQENLEDLIKADHYGRILLQKWAEIVEYSRDIVELQELFNCSVKNPFLFTLMRISTLEHQKSINTELGSYTSELHYVENILTDFSEERERIESLSVSTALQCNEISYYEALHNVMTEVCIALAEFAENQSVISAKAQISLSDGLLMPSEAVELKYIEKFMQFIEEFLKDESTQIDNFSTALFPMHYVTKEVTFRSNRVFTSQSAFCGELGKLFKRAALWEISEKPGRFDFPQMLEQYQTIQQECVDAMQQNSSKQQIESMELRKHAEAQQNALDRDVTSALAEEIITFIGAELNSITTSSRFNQYLGVQALQDLLAYLHVVCDDIAETEPELQETLCLVQSRIDEFNCSKAEHRVSRIEDVFVVLNE